MLWEGEEEVEEEAVLMLWEGEKEEHEEGKAVLMLWEGKEDTGQKSRCQGKPRHHCSSSFPF